MWNNIKKAFGFCHRRHKSVAQKKEEIFLFYKQSLEDSSHKELGLFLKECNNELGRNVYLQAHDIKDILQRLTQHYHTLKDKS